MSHDLNIKIVASAKDLLRPQNEPKDSDCLTEGYRIMKPCDPAHVALSL
jgi:hypothetical protein